MIGGNSGGMIKGYIERLSRLSEEIEDLRTDVNEIYVEAKSHGFDVKALRLLLKSERMSSGDKKKLDELDDTVSIYRQALKALTTDVV